MSQSIEKLLNAEADKQAELDELIEGKSPEALEMFRDLLTNADNRDAELFEEFGIDPSLTVADYEAVLPFDRGPDWVMGFSAMWAASRMQVWLDLYALDILELSEREGRKIEKITKGMELADMVKAGKQGIGKERFKAARERKKNAIQGTETQR